MKLWQKANQPPSPKKDSFFKKILQKNSWVPLFFLGPWLVVFFLFQLYPIGYSLFIAFTDLKALSITTAKWVGLDNFLTLFKSSEFLNGLKISFYFVIGTVPITLALAIGVSFLLRKKIAFRQFYQFAFFAPSVISVLVIANLFSEIYSENGLLNDFLVGLGLRPILLLKSTHFALLAVMMMNIWASFGFYALLFLAQLQNIPQEYYEIAELEGHSALQQAIFISLPLLMPMVKVAFLLNSILAFQVFGEIYVLTKGGPVQSTQTAVFYIFDKAFSEQKLGLASAAAYFVFLILVGVSFFTQLKNPQLKNAWLWLKRAKNLPS